MGIQIADQFTYSGSKPLDARLQFSSVANMKAASESSLYNGCFAYVTATKKYYSFDSSNSVDPTTGKWREYSSGSGEDTNAYHTGDTAETTLDNADYFPFYDTSATAKRKTLWSNIKSNLKTYFDTLYNKYTLPTATSSVLGGVKIGENMLIEDGVINPSYLVVANKFNKSDIYSTTEKVVGCWTDGRPIYQKTLSCGTLPSAPTGSASTSSKEVATGVSNINRVLSVNGYARRSTDGLTIPLQFVSSASVISTNYALSGAVSILFMPSTNVFRLDTSQDRSAFTESYITFQYTKTTDAANSFKYADENDYSTNEKIVGSWINGANLYQKTISTTTPSTASSTKSVTLGTSYNVLFIDAICKPSGGGAVPIPWCLEGIQSGNTMWIFQDTISGDIKIQGASNIGSAFLNAPLYITIKYTK